MSESKSTRQASAPVSLFPAPGKPLQEPGAEGEGLGEHSDQEKSHPHRLLHNFLKSFFNIKLGNFVARQFKWLKWL